MALDNWSIFRAVSIIRSEFFRCSKYSYLLTPPVPARRMEVAIGSVSKMTRYMLSSLCSRSFKILSNRLTSLLYRWYWVRISSFSLFRAFSLGESIKANIRRSITMAKEKLEMNFWMAFLILFLIVVSILSKDNVSELKWYPAFGIIWFVCNKFIVSGAKLKEII